MSMSTIGEYIRVLDLKERDAAVEVERVLAGFVRSDGITCERHRCFVYEDVAERTRMNRSVFCPMCDEQFEGGSAIPGLVFHIDAYPHPYQIVRFDYTYWPEPHARVIDYSPDVAWNHFKNNSFYSI